MWWIIPGLLVAGAVVWGPVVSDAVEQPSYQVVEERDGVEIRDYGPIIVAETAVAGEREQAVGEGFRRIADYIFGNNLAAGPVSRDRGAVTTSASPSEKIAMTAPVLQQADGTRQANGNLWQIRFVMPARYTMATLPTPRNPAVSLVALPGRRYVVARFSGFAGDDSLRRHTAILDAFISVQHLQSLSPPVYAFYNPPWTLPFLRRNEVMVEIAR